jgi:hypothetical protein
LPIRKIGTAPVTLVAVLIDGDRFEQAASPLEAGLAAAREQGSLPGLASLTGLKVIVAWRRGTLFEVEAFSRVVLELLTESGHALV